MAIILSTHDKTVELPNDLEWIDEYMWTPVSHQISTSLSGSLVIQQSRLQKGRKITLQGGSDFAWLNKEQLQDLKTLLDRGEIMTLTLHSQTFQVMFRYNDNPLSYSSVAPNLSKYCNVRIALMEV